MPLAIFSDTIIVTAVRDTLGFAVGVLDVAAEGVVVWVCFR